MRRAGEILGPLAVAALGGCLWGLCFGRDTLSWAPWIALAPLLLLLGRRRAIGLALLHGFAFWLASIPWLAPTLEAYGALPGWLALALLGLLALYLALFQAAFAWLAAPAWRRGGAAALFLVPGLWVAMEWLRAHLLGGFPWNLAAYAWVELPGALEVSAWIGAYGVSYLVLMANCGVARSVATRRFGPGLLAVSLALLTLAVGGRWASLPRAADGSPRLPVRIIQPNTQNLVSWDPQRVAEGYRRLFHLSRQACDVPGALLVWPESAAWPYAWDRDQELRADLAALSAEGCSVLFNSPLGADREVTNSGLLLTPDGIRGRYDKVHLVPFGEHVPLARWLPFIGKLARHAGDFAAGTDAALLSWRGERLGVAICFEIIFPGEVADRVRRGATLLATVTNDAWYGDTAAPWQHFRAARFRAAESRRHVLRAAITGVSAVIGPDGSVEQLLSVNREGVLAAEVAGRSDLSPFSRWPWLPPAACTLAGMFAILLGRRRSSR